MRKIHMVVKTMMPIMARAKTMAASQMSSLLSLSMISLLFSYYFKTFARLRKEEKWKPNSDINS